MKTILLVLIYLLEASSKSTKNSDYYLTSYDIIHTIKTGKYTQDTRLPRILNTWYNDVITDYPMKVEMEKKIKDGHLVITDCLKVLFIVI